MESRQQKIELLSRLNRGKTVVDSFLASLSEVLACEVKSDALQSLPETDTLWRVFGDGYGGTTKSALRTYRRMFNLGETARVFQIAECLAGSLRNETAFLLNKQSEICGAVKVDAANLLMHSEPAIRLDGDSIRIVSEDRTQGLMIDCNLDDAEWHYEVAVWGDRWAPLCSLATGAKLDEAT